jgi:hypothetical protein
MMIRGQIGQQNIERPLNERDVLKLKKVRDRIAHKKVEIVRKELNNGKPVLIVVQKCFQVVTCVIRPVKPICIHTVFMYIIPGI